MINENAVSLMEWGYLMLLTHNKGCITHNIHDQPVSEGKYSEYVK